MKTKKLKQLTVTKVSLVGRGSNPGAHVAIFKSDPAHAPLEISTQEIQSPDPSSVLLTLDGREVAKATFNELLLAEQKRKALWKIADSIYTMQDAMYSSMYADDPDSEIRRSVKEFGAYVDTLLDALKTNSLDGDAAIAKQQVKKKAEGIFARLFPQETPMSKQAVETPTDPNPATEEVKLSELPQSVQKLIADQAAAVAKAQAAADDAIAKADAATAQVAKETAARELLECEKEAQAEIPHLPGTPAELGKMLYDLKKSLTPEAYATTMTSLKAGSAAVRSEMTAKGIDTPGSSDNTAEAELDRIAGEMMKADPKLKKSTALSKAYNDNPKLYKQFIAEEKASGRRAQ